LTQATSDISPIPQFFTSFLQSPQTFWTNTTAQMLQASGHYMYTVKQRRPCQYQHNLSAVTHARGCHNYCVRRSRRRLMPWWQHAVWSSGMILEQGAKDPGFTYRHSEVELTREDPIGLVSRRLNQSAKMFWLRPGSKVPPAISLIQLQVTKVQEYLPRW